MPDVVLAVDAGTTSVRALVVDPEGRILASAGSGCTLNYPVPGWVEQDPEQLWASANDVFMQIQADALGQPVEGMAPIEATAFGAALLAGQATGVWGPDAVDQLRKIDRVFEPAWFPEERDERFNHWRKACGLIG